MTDSSLKVGVVGTGIIAETHVPYIRKAGGRVVGLADISLARANELADRHAIQNVYRSVGELIEGEAPDVIHVLTPPHTHAAVAIEALERGIHVLVEKPMAVDPADAEAMIAAAAASGAMLTVDHNRLFDPPMLRAHELVASGALGEIVGVESYQAGLAADRPWLASMPGGSLGDLIPHPLYLQLAFLGPVLDLEARAFGAAGDGRTDELRVLMQGERTSGVLTISTGAKPWLNTLKIYGTRMTVEVNCNNMTIVTRRDYDVPKIIAKPLPNLDEAWQLVSQTVASTVNFLRGTVRYYPGMGTLIDRFYTAIRGGTEPPVGIEQGADVVRVTARIWESLGGRPLAAARDGESGAQSGRESQAAADGGDAAGSNDDDAVVAVEA